VFVVVGRDGQATLPREILAAAMAEPGDLIECVVSGPQAIDLHVIFRIPNPSLERVLAAHESATDASIASDQSGPWLPSPSVPYPERGESSE